MPPSDTSLPESHSMTTASSTSSSSHGVDSKSLSASSSSTSPPPSSALPCTQPCTSPPASQPFTLYPSILPPPDFFDLEAEAEKLKDMFKKDNSLKNPLYDETGLVNLPADDKGILILDPESRTKMVDVEVELDVLYEYMAWMTSAAKEEGMDEGSKKEWLEGLREAVNEDLGEVFDEWHKVVDEERKKRGLTDRYTHWASYKKQAWDPEKKKWSRIQQKNDGPSQLENGALPPVPSEDTSVEELLPREVSGTIITESEETKPLEGVCLGSTQEGPMSRESDVIHPMIDLVTLWW